MSFKIQSHGALFQSPNGQFCHVQGDCFVKAFQSQMRLMVIGLESAPVPPLIWVEDDPLS